MASSRGSSGVDVQGCATFPEFVWIWNRTQGLATPSIHLRMSRWLHERWIGGDRELVLLAFRSSGKSTLTGLFCAWLLLEHGWTQGANVRQILADQGYLDTCTIIDLSGNDRVSGGRLAD